MRRTFNMGLGLAVGCRGADADAALQSLAEAGEREARIVGRIEPGDRRVRYTA
jgi:phosphoribosylaminoimidazole (AIR) synthetase